MTQLMGRPILDLPGELSSRSVPADLLAGVRTALLGLAAVAVPILGLWVVTPYADDTAGGAARLAGTVWLLGHGGPLGRGGSGAPLTVTPLLLTLLTAWQLHRAGRRAAGGPAAARTGARAGGRGGAVAVGAGYLMVVAGVAVLGASGGTPGPAGAAFRARVLPDVLAAALLVVVAVGAGVRSARPGGAPGHGWSARFVPAPGRLPSWIWPAARAEAAAVVRRAALAGALGLVGAGALLVATSAVLDALVGGRPLPPAGGGVAGALGLLLLCVVLLPNAVVWGAAYALGPGFVVGTGAVVAPSGAMSGPVPAVPLFELLPAPGEGGWRWLACLLPLLAGLTPAVLLGRAAAGRGGPAGLPSWGAEDSWGRPDEADEAAEASRDGRAVGDGGEDGDGGRPAGPAAAGAWHPVATAAVALAVALLAAVVVAAGGWLAGGALGTGRMAQLGPVPWQVGTAAAGWFAGVGVPGALAVRAWLVRGGTSSTGPAEDGAAAGVPVGAPVRAGGPDGEWWRPAGAAALAGALGQELGVRVARARAAAYGLVLRCGPRPRP
ncbi:cell division protein PerM [Kitasatospora indigofera]|uniref:cell division protein PerM n=1 Tax=Kitasatospora indigofera TaxID=67307 RepID=UPI0033B14EE5